MATRLSVKKKKLRRDRKTAYLKCEHPAPHKIAAARSKRMKKKMMCPA